MKIYNVIKPVSIFFFAMIAFIGSDNAFANYTAKHNIKAELPELTWGDV